MFTYHGSDNRCKLHILSMVVLLKHHQSSHFRGFESFGRAIQLIVEERACVRKKAGFYGKCPYHSMHARVVGKPNCTPRKRKIGRWERQGRKGQRKGNRDSLVPTKGTVNSRRCRADLPIGVRNPSEYGDLPERRFSGRSAS